MGKWDGKPTVRQRKKHFKIKHHKACAHNFYVCINHFEWWPCIDGDGKIVCFYSIVIWHATVYYTHSAYCLHVNLKFVKCKQRKPHVCKSLHKPTHARPCLRVCVQSIDSIHWKLCMLSWVEQKAAIAKQIGGRLRQSIFSSNSLVRVVTSEINIEFMRFNITNSTHIHSTMAQNWLLLPISVCLHCLAVKQLVARFSLAFLKLLALYNQFWRRFLCSMFIRIIIFAIGNGHIVSRAFFALICGRRQREEMKISRYGWAH